MTSTNDKDNLKKNEIKEDSERNEDELNQDIELTYKLISSHLRLASIFTGFSFTWILYLFTLSSVNIEQYRVSVLIAFILLSIILFLFSTLIFANAESSILRINYYKFDNLSDKENYFEKIENFNRGGIVVFFFGIIFFIFSLIALIFIFFFDSLEVLIGLFVLFVLLGILFITFLFYYSIYEKTLIGIPVFFFILIFKITSSLKQLRKS